jgi:hypothetical protein
MMAQLSLLSVISVSLAIGGVLLAGIALVLLPAIWSKSPDAKSLAEIVHILISHRAERIASHAHVRHHRKDDTQR